MIERSVAETGGPALRIARDAGTEGIAEAILEGEVDLIYGLFLVELLERVEVKG